MLKVGRNQPCPCGSGLKYKRCCLRWQADDQRLYRLREKLRGQLLLFAEGRGEELIDEAWRDFWEGDPPYHWEGSELFDLFSGWFVFLWVPREHRDMETGGAPHPATLAARLLESDPPLEPAERRLLEAARQEPLSFWEIESIDGQGRAGVRDMVLGRRLELRLPPSHDCLGDNCIVLAQVIPADGTHILGAPSPPLGTATFRKPLEEASEILREQHGVRTPRDLLAFNLPILHITRNLVETVLNPRLTNTDGEQVVFTWSFYSFEPARRAELMGLLRSMRNLRYLGDPLDPLGSEADGEQLALDLGFSGPERPVPAEEEEEEEEEDREEVDDQKLLPFPGTTRDAHEEEEDEEDGLIPSELIERLMDAEGKEPTSRPAFLWRLRRSGTGTTLARIHVLEEMVMTVTNSAPRDEKLRLRLGRNAGHILGYMGSRERSFWQTMAGVFAGDED